jgi:hypothetical protein
MTEEDEAFDTLEKASGWRKRQIAMNQTNNAFDNDVFDAMDRDHDHKYIKHQLHPMPASRNDTIEEVAREIEKMKAFGPDTIASFAAYVRNMKDAKT